MSRVYCVVMHGRAPASCAKWSPRMAPRLQLLFCSHVMRHATRGNLASQFFSESKHVLQGRRLEEEAGGVYKPTQGFVILIFFCYLNRTFETVLLQEQYVT